MCHYRRNIIMSPSLVCCLLTAVALATAGAPPWLLPRPTGLAELTSCLTPPKIQCAPLSCRTRKRRCCIVYYNWGDYNWGGSGIDSVQLSQHFWYHGITQRDTRRPDQSLPWDNAMMMIWDFKREGDALFRHPQGS